MKRDLRETQLYQETETLYRLLRHPGQNLISDAVEVNASPDGLSAVFTGTIVDMLEGSLPTRICRFDFTTGETQILTSGPNTDRMAKFSPNGAQLAFLSDRHQPGNFQLHFLEVTTGEVTPGPIVEGWIEYLHWSHDSRHILLGVAGHGADVASGQGAIASKQTGNQLPCWLPMVEIGNEDYRWRHAWVYDVENGSVRQVSKNGLNIWEAVWCGDHAIAAVTSPGPSEALWYAAKLSLIDIESGEDRTIYTPKDQLGWPSATPSGNYLAIVEAFCSDRWIVAGDLLLFKLNKGEIKRICTNGVDVTHTQWRSETRLQFIGVRNSERVIGEYDINTRKVTETWSSEEINCGFPYPVMSPFGNNQEDCLLVGEGFMRAPEIATIRKGEYTPITSLDRTYADRVTNWIRSVETISWQAPDGLEIQGWLLRPQGQDTHAVIMHIHGGPIWQSQPWWMGRSSTLLTNLLLLKRGYAVFMPNPRGSTGKGQVFARHVYGDMGGADTHDLLSGLDYLIEHKIADPKRLGIIGGSYGGFMTAWLICQNQRFAAAVPVVPITDWVSQHLVSNIPQWDTTYLDGFYNEPESQYFSRSPIMYANQVSTPTLNICGALDRSAPPNQAMEFHNALLEYGVKSVLVTYPEEGHGVRKLPTVIDYASRVVAWFEEHIQVRQD